jgi:hypothetical protein
MGFAFISQPENWHLLLCTLSPTSPQPWFRPGSLLTSQVLLPSSAPPFQQHSLPLNPACPYQPTLLWSPVFLRLGTRQPLYYSLHLVSFLTNLPQYQHCAPSRPCIGPLDGGPVKRIPMPFCILASPPGIPS